MKQDKNFIVTEKQRTRLKDLLNDEEYNEVFSHDWEEFSYALSRCIDVRYIDDAPTPESDAIENIYYEIYEQNK